MHSFGMSILREKHAQIEKLIAASTFDVWLVFSREAADPISPLVVGTRYVGAAAFFFGKKKKVALCAAFDALPIEQTGLFDEVTVHTGQINEPLANLLEETGPQTIAINYSRSDHQADGISYGMFLELEDIVRSVLPTASFVSAEEFVQSIRARKTPEELRRIKQAIKISEGIFADLLTFTHPGLTERAIGERAAALAHQQGAELSGGEIIVATGKAGLAHRSPTDAPVTPGDVVVVDMGICYEGYNSDFARTYYVPTEDGSIPEALTIRVEAVRDTIAFAAEMIRPGVPAYQVKEAADRFLEQRGFEPPWFALGHQVGTAVHDGGLALGRRTPSGKGQTERQIQEDMVLTLEPFLLPKAGEQALPVGIEEIVVVTSHGCEFLTRRQEDVWVVTPETRR